MTAAALVPCAPALLPELTGPRSPELSAVRSAVEVACRHLVDARSDLILVAAPASDGGLAGFGAPLPDELPVGLPIPGWTWELGVRLLVRAGARGAIRVAGHGVVPPLPSDAALLVLSDGAPTDDPPTPGVALFLAVGAAPPRIAYTGAPLGTDYVVALR